MNGENKALSLDIMVLNALNSKMREKYEGIYILINTVYPLSWFK